MNKIVIGVGIVVLVVLILLIPFATIWALNTLFALGIVYTWQTWLSVMVLNLTVLGGVNHTVKNNLK